MKLSRKELRKIIMTEVVAGTTAQHDQTFASDKEIEKPSKRSRGAHNWLTYIAAGKDADDRRTRKLIKRLWEKMAGDDKYGHPHDKRKPAHYTPDYKSWVEWYKVVANDNVVASIVGKDADGDLSPVEVGMILLDYKGFSPDARIADSGGALFMQQIEDALTLDGDALKGYQPEQGTQKASEK